MEKVVFKKPHALTDVPFHYCAGCTHGIIHRLVAEVIDELGCGTHRRCFSCRLRRNEL